MSDLILAALIACAVLLPAAIVMHRSATAPPEPHDHREGCACISCTELRHPRTRALLAARISIPVQREGE